MRDRALNQKEYDRKFDAVKVCGSNRGPHDYIPIRWERGETAEQVTHLMCRICFVRVSIKTLVENFPEATL
jgi:hypothetical protein